MKLLQSQKDDYFSSQKISIWEFCDFIAQAELKDYNFWSQKMGDFCVPQGSINDSLNKQRRRQCEESWLWMYEGKYVRFHEIGEKIVGNFDRFQKEIVRVFVDHMVGYNDLGDHMDVLRFGYYKDNDFFQIEWNIGPGVVIAGVVNGETFFDVDAFIRECDEKYHLGAYGCSGDYRGYLFVYAPHWSTILHRSSKQNPSGAYTNK